MGLCKAFFKLQGGKLAVVLNRNFISTSSSNNLRSRSASASAKAKAKAKDGFNCVLFSIFFEQTQCGKTQILCKSLFYLTEIFLHSSRRNNLLLSLPSIRTEGNRSGVIAIRTDTGGSAADNDREKTRSSNGRSYDSSSLEEISALFKRIQTSIANEKSTTSMKRSSNSSKEKPSAKPMQEKNSNMKSNELLTTGWRGELQKAEKKFSPATAEMKPTRPPSNFVKRSPIAPLQITNQKDELKIGSSSSDIATKEQKSLEDMKLPALKELAKSRGIRGYSKLKKSELIELLMA